MSSSPISNMGILQHSPLASDVKKRKREEIENIIRAGLLATTLDARIKATKDKKYKLTPDELVQIETQVKSRVKDFKASLASPTTTAVTAITSENLLFTESMLNYKAIESHKHKLESHRSKGFIKSFVELLSDDGVKDTISVYLTQYLAKNPSIEEKDWTRWSDDEIYSALLVCFPLEAQGATGYETLKHTAGKLDLSVWQPTNAASIQSMVTRMVRLSHTAAQHALTVEQVSGLVEETVERWETDAKAAVKELVSDLRSRPDGLAKTFTALATDLVFVTENIQHVAQKAERLGLSFTNVKLGKTGFKITSEQGDAVNSDKSKKLFPCRGCGRTGHFQSDCIFKKHPDFNKSTKLSWEYSAQGLAWSKFQKKVLPANKKLSADKKSYEDLDLQFPKKEGKDLGCNSELLCSVCKPSHDHDYLFPASVQVKENEIPVSFLLDTGALASDYISVNLARTLEEAGVVKLDDNCGKVVCSALLNTNCEKCYGTYKFTIRFKNESNDKFESVTIRAIAINMRFDLIIGRKSAIKHDLIAKYLHKFSKANLSEGRTAVLNNVFGRSHISTLGQCYPCSVQPASRGQEKQILSSLLQSPAKHVSEYESYEKDEDFIDKKDDPYDPIVDREYDEIPFIDGTESLRARLKALVHEYADIFSHVVRSEHADVKPMTLEVTPELWYLPKNQRRVRMLTQTKQDAMREAIDEMLALGVIRESQATHYSHPLMVPKPNSSKLRFCLDFRPLNEVSKSMGWPLPNIELMLHRLGSARAKYFAVIDLTSGYHQIPLAEEAKKFTAFTTPFGLYEWNRVPMGLKGAPSYFQQQMTSTVLKGLYQRICEVYIDDVIVYGKDEEEFLMNLRTVFERFRRFRITLNPKKCKLGLNRVEYVGRIIDDTGLSFSKEKREQIVNLGLPKRQKDLKSFIGLIGFFRNHVEGHSVLVKPLQDMITPYQPHKILKWNDELEKLYTEVKDRVVNCPKLYFLNSTDPVFLHTDACDTGMGAYLFQVVDGVERPIQFMSKGFNRTQLRWSTPEKECFAIYYALRKFEHLIRDSHFTLRTDHKNLIYLNETGFAKVVRWKLEIQEYDFHIEHIAGLNNFVADSFSRLSVTNIVGYRTK